MTQCKLWMSFLLLLFSWTQLSASGTHSPYVDVEGQVNCREGDWKCHRKAYYQGVKDNRDSVYGHRKVQDDEIDFSVWNERENSCRRGDRECLRRIYFEARSNSRCTQNPDSCQDRQLASDEVEE